MSNVYHGDDESNENAMNHIISHQTQMILCHQPGPERSLPVITQTTLYASGQ